MLGVSRYSTPDLNRVLCYIYHKIMTGKLDEKATPVHPLIHQSIPSLLYVIEMLPFVLPHGGY